MLDNPKRAIRRVFLCYSLRRIRTMESRGDVVGVGSGVGSGFEPAANHPFIDWKDS